MGVRRQDVDGRASVATARREDNVFTGARVPRQSLRHSAEPTPTHHQCLATWCRGQERCRSTPRVRQRVMVVKFQHGCPRAGIASSDVCVRRLNQGELGCRWPPRLAARTGRRRQLGGHISTTHRDRHDAPASRQPGPAPTSKVRRSTSRVLRRCPTHGPPPICGSRHSNHKGSPSAESCPPALFLFWCRSPPQAVKFSRHPSLS